MKLPETQNANHLYAFKKGYRLAMEGKPLSLMPNQIKRDIEMREYFEIGWQQYQDDLTEATENDDEAPWRNKTIWMVMAIIAGLATASLMIHKIQQEKLPKGASFELTKQPEQSPDAQTAQHTNDLRLITDSTNSKKSNTLTEKPKQTITTTNISPKKQSNDSSLNEHNETNNPLSLLSSNERKDLTHEKQLYEQSQTPVTPTEPIISSTIQITRSNFTNGIKNHEPDKIFTKLVPKYIRKIYFFTQVNQAKGQTLYHQWRYNGKIMATIPLPIKSNHFRTWSSKRLSSAWSGQWEVEVLNAQKQPIFRTFFQYAS